MFVYREEYYLARTEPGADPSDPASNEKWAKWRQRTDLCSAVALFTAFASAVATTARTRTQTRQHCAWKRGFRGPIPILQP